MIGYHENQVLSEASGSAQSEAQKTDSSNRDPLSRGDDRGQAE